MQLAGRKSKQLFNEINITPLTDIFLVLLIIMMVVAPMMQQVRHDIKPPQLQSGAPVEQNKLTVEITKDGVIYVQGKAAKPEQLATVFQEQETLLNAKSGGSSHGNPTGGSAAANASDAANEKGLIIRADKATKSGQVLKIFEAARDAGYVKVTVAGEALSQERQAQLEQPGAAEPTSSNGPNDTEGVQ